MNHDLGGASQPFAKITLDPEPCMTMLLEKLQKSDRSLEDCCDFQGSVMAAVGKWRDDEGCSKFTAVSLERAIR